jgi:glutathione S-transferase
MHLIGSLASPFVQSCLIVARTKGHDFDVVPPPGGTMQSPEFQAISPMGRVPLLALDGGGYLCESSAISAHLDETLTGPALLPDAPAARGRVREIATIAMGELAAGLRPVLVHRIFNMSQNEPVVAAGLAQADRGCVALGRLMADSTGPYALGGAITLADAALVPFVTLATVIAQDADVAALLARHAFLTAYLARTQADPILARTPHEMRDAFAAIVARRTQAAKA